MTEPKPAATAIVGMAALFPGAPDLASYWRNIQTGVDAVGEVPSARIDPVFFAQDGFYCRRGGFIDEHAVFDPAAFGIMPVAAEGAEPDQLLALAVAARALADAGYDSGTAARERTGVILGRGGYLTPGIARLDQHLRSAEQLVRSLRGLLPDLDESSLSAIKHEFRSQLGACRGDTAIGLVPNLVASRIANRLDLRGPAYTVDAACASSLLAVDQARSELHRGRCDLVIAGGVHVCHDVTLWSVFTQLGALSRRGQIRPFDRRADGLLIGEGVGLLVLKRHADALRDGDRIYAVIRGSGVASDGRGSSLMNPSVEGQVLALERAWRDAELDPASVGLIEAHGTGTPAGDSAELQTLERVFGQGDSEVVLGSVKSMIGHSMPAAGAAGLIKAALAIYHQSLPPTLHCEEPHAALAKLRFRTLRASAPWDRAVRRAGVNAFGFGGINAHVVLEQSEQPALRRARSSRSLPALALWAAADAGALQRLLDEGATCGGEGPCRLALLDPTPARLAKARAIIERGRAWNGRQEIWFSPHGLLDAGGRIAFLFPGIEAEFDPRVQDVAAHFGLSISAWQGATELERQGGRLIAVGQLLDASLRRIGIQPDVIAGHSIGEWNGMIASGMISAQAVEAFMAALAPGSLAVPDVVFAALGCSADVAREHCAGIAGLSISHDNCPHQAVVCGPEPAIDELLARLRAQRVLSGKLPFRSGFHSPAFASYLAGPRAKTRELLLQPPHTALWSATTCAPYPAGAEAVRALVIDHLTEPVRFRELIDALYASGVRAFIEVGQGSLTGFVEDTLGTRPHLTAKAHAARRTGLEQLRRLAIALYVAGARPDFSALPGELQARAPRKLSLGTPLVNASPAPLAVLFGLPSQPHPPEASPALIAEFGAAMRENLDAQRQVIEAWRRSRTRPVLEPRARTLRREFSLCRHPELIDHCFYRQPEKWPSLADRYPVVPMTMQLEVMLEAARELVPELVPIAIEAVRAYRFCGAEPAQTVDVACHFDGRTRVEVRVGEYALGHVVMAERSPEPPPPRPARLRDPQPSPVAARALYDQRFMFHGPAYQGVLSIDALAEDGIRGVLAARPACGALLDNAGQLLGFWVMQRFERDRLAFPARIERVSLYGDWPRANARVDCTVWIESVSDTEVGASMQLCDAEGRVVCEVRGWTDRRFDTDEVSWPLLRFPESRLLSVRRAGHYYHCSERWRGTASRDLMARRYLDERERAQWQALPPAGRSEWLLGRIALKDAVRDVLWRAGAGPIYPVEIAVRDAADGRPLVSGPFQEELRVALAHRDRIALAIVGRSHDVGIDLQRIAARDEDFVEGAFSASERALQVGADRDESLARIWAARQAAAGSWGGNLPGGARDCEVIEIAGQRMLVAAGGAASIWVQTERDGAHVFAWTCERRDQA